MSKSKKIVNGLAYNVKAVTIGDLIEQLNKLAADYGKDCKVVCDSAEAEYFGIREEDYAYAHYDVYLNRIVIDCDQSEAVGEAVGKWNEEKQKIEYYA